MLRLEGFLGNNGYPHRRLDPDTDSCARTLLERFEVSRSELPIVLCPSGELLRNPTERQLARCHGLSRIVAYVGRVPLPASWAEAAEIVEGMFGRHFTAVPSQATPSSECRGP